MPGEKPSISHDQNFKNLILDYPIQAIEFFSPQEAEALDESVRITPIRQEQLKERLGERFRELDVPLLAEWPDGRREAILFVFEEETNPRRFSIHRLAHYCLDLSDLCQTERVVPVVVFLNSNGKEPVRLELRSERYSYLKFHYIRCALADMKAEDYWHSHNLIARLCLSLMNWSQNQKLKVFASAVSGLAYYCEREHSFLRYVNTPSLPLAGFTFLPQVFTCWQLLLSFSAGIRLSVPACVRCEAGDPGWRPPGLDPRSLRASAVSATGW